VAINPYNENTIYLGGSESNSGVVFKTEDGGQSWIKRGSEVFDNSMIYAVVVDPDSPNRIYAGASDGVYRSHDSGLSWTPPSKSFSSRCIALGNPLSDEIYAAGWAGVHYSSNGGSSWELINDGLDVSDVNCMDINLKDDIKYAGTIGGSIYLQGILGGVKLTIEAGFGGTTDPSPGSRRYPPDTNVEITAIPDTYYGFSHWSGDVSGTANPVTVTLDSDKYVKANFVKILPPSNATGERKLNRSVLISEYVDILNWNPNPVNSDILKYRIYSINGSTKNLLAEVDTGTTQYWCRDAENSPCRYAIAAVNGAGQEGEPAYVDINPL